MDCSGFIVASPGNKKDVLSIFIASHTSLLDTETFLVGFYARCVTVTVPLTLRNCNSFQPPIKPCPKINFHCDIRFIFVSLVSTYGSISLISPLERNEHSVRGWNIKRLQSEGRSTEVSILKPSGDYVPPRLTLRHSVFCLHYAFVFVELTSLYSINLRHCIIQTQYVYCAVQTGFFYITSISIIKRLIIFV